MLNKLRDWIVSEVNGSGVTFGQSNAEIRQLCLNYPCNIVAKTLRVNLLSEILDGLREDDEQSDDRIIANFRQWIHSERSYLYKKIENDFDEMTIEELCKQHPVLIDLAIRRRLLTEIIKLPFWTWSDD